jgi:RNA recognition motif-containing protein
MKKIYVGNLSFNVTEDEVRLLFEKHGPVENVRIVTDRNTGRSKGFGFIEMLDDESASKAMEALNGARLGGRLLTVSAELPGTEQLPPRKPRKG